MTNKRRISAFTIVELMVVLAIAGILLGLALPAFNGFMEQRAMTTRVNEFVLAVNYARSEAAKLGGLVSLQTVNAGDSDNEWGPGYCVTVGNPGNCNNALRSFGGFDNATLDAVGALDDVAVLSFNARGLLTLGVALDPANDRIELCSTDATVNPGRQITLNIVGRVASAEFVCP